MRVKVFLSTVLRRHIPGYAPSEGLDIEIQKGDTVADMCRHIHIPIDEVKIIMVEGRRQEPDYKLNADERIYLFPPVGGG